MRAELGACRVAGCRDSIVAVRWGEVPNCSCEGLPGNPTLVAVRPSVGLGCRSILGTWHYARRFALSLEKMSHPALDRRLLRLLAINKRYRDPDLFPVNRKPILIELQRFQAARLRESFADFLASPRERPAAEFFLSDLYGDFDVSARDNNIERVLPIMRRVLPVKLLAAAADAIELSALSHAFDVRVAGVLSNDGVQGPVELQRYARAYRKAGLPRLRAHQVGLIQHVGESLDRTVSKPLIGQLLRISRMPARAAGLGELQSFLERGFDAFRALGGSGPFVNEIAARELHVSERLFASDPNPFRAR